MSSPKSAPLWRTCDLALRPHVAYPLCLTSPGPGALSQQILCSQDSLSDGASLFMAPLSLPNMESTPGVRGPWELRTWVFVSHSLFLCPAGLEGRGFKELLLSACWPLVGLECAETRIQASATIALESSSFSVHAKLLFCRAAITLPVTLVGHSPRSQAFSRITAPCKMPPMDL